MEILFRRICLAMLFFICLSFALIYEHRNNDMFHLEDHCYQCNFCQWHNSCDCGMRNEDSISERECYNGSVVSSRRKRGLTSEDISRGNFVVSIFVCLLVINAVACGLITLAMIIIQARLENPLRKRLQMKRKLEMKADHRGCPGGMKGDDEGTPSEKLGLEMMMVRLKLPRRAAGVSSMMIKDKKYCSYDFDPDMGGIVPCGLPELGKKTIYGPHHSQCGCLEVTHCFSFRRDTHFSQTVQAYPLTQASLTRHFVSQGPPGSGQLELQKEGVRLSTFKDFPHYVPVSVLRLAQAGFYYLSERDLVKCFSCCATYEGWQFGDKPVVIHKRISPDCRFVRGTDDSNIPLPLSMTSLAKFDDEVSSMDSGYGSAPYVSSSTDLQPDSPGRAAPPSSGEAMSRTESPYTAATEGPSTLATSMTPASADSGTSSAPPSLPPSSSSYSMNGVDSQHLSVPTRRLDLGGAVYPLYSQLDARRRSFNAWPATSGLPSVNELVTLGFFYAGYADCVRCFFCGIGLKSWEVEDIPAEVHARWRPTCEYLRLVKGDIYVDTVASGGRNVAENDSRSSDGSGHSTGNPPAGGSNTNQQGTLPPVPDIPIVQRARESGYTDQQIAEAIDKLHIIGMAAAIDVMLLEILTNLFSTYSNQSNRASINQPPARGGGTGTSGSSSGPGRNEPLTSSRDADLQHDGPQTSGAPALDGPALQERHQELQQENARLREMRTCHRCRERPVGVIFLPCGHIVACTECAPSIRRCLRCDSMIRATANVFFS